MRERIDGSCAGGLPRVADLFPLDNRAGVMRRLRAGVGVVGQMGEARAVHQAERAVQAGCQQGFVQARVSGQKRIATEAENHGPVHGVELHADAIRVLRGEAVIHAGSEGERRREGVGHQFPARATGGGERRAKTGEQFADEPGFETP